MICDEYEQDDDIYDSLVDDALLAADEAGLADNSPESKEFIRAHVSTALRPRTWQPRFVGDNR